MKNMPLICVIVGIVAGLYFDNVWYFLSACGGTSYIFGRMNGDDCTARMQYHDIPEEKKRKAATTAFINAIIAGSVLSLGCGFIARLIFK
jgi:hypothetical protein